MKTQLIIGSLICAFCVYQPALSQNLRQPVVATHVDYSNAVSSTEKDLLRDVNASLHSIFKNNGFNLASIENEDRVMSNLLNAMNFRDAEVRSTTGDPIDCVYTIWIEIQGGYYKVYSKRIGRVNSDYFLANPVTKDESLILCRSTKLIRELIALQITEQFISLSPQNKRLLENRLNDEKQIIAKIRQEAADHQAGIEAEKRMDRVLTWVAPSAVHFRNGQSTSGALLLTGELLSVGGGIFTYAKANSLVKTLQDDDWNRKRNDGTAMTDFDRAKLEGQYRAYQVVNYVCWGAAAVLYAVNVATSYKIVSDKRYVLVPSIQQNSMGDLAYGVTLTYRF